MEDKSEAGDAEAAMAAMGLPANFAAPAFPRAVAGAGKGIRPPPPGPSNRGGRGRDGGWAGRGRGANNIYTNANRPPPQTPSGPSARRGGPHQNFANARGIGNKRKRGGLNYHPVPHQEGPLPALEDVGECNVVGFFACVFLILFSYRTAIPSLLYRRRSLVPPRVNNLHYCIFIPLQTTANY